MKLRTYGTWVAKKVERSLGRIGLLAFHWPKATLSLVALSCVLSFWLASHLVVNADLSELLPRSFSSLKAFDVLKERFGGIGFMVVTGKEAEPEDLRRFARDVAEKVETLKTVRYVDYLRPVEFFKAHAAYFLDVPDLEKIRQRLQERLDWEKLHKNPLYVDLEGGDPPSLELKDVQDNYASRGDRRWVQGQLGESYYLDPDRRLVAIFIKPSEASTDLDYTRKLVGDIKDAVQSMDLTKYPGIRVGFTGTYTKHIDQQEVIDKDLRVASILAFVLIFAYFAFHFHQVGGVIVGLGPMLIGTIWTYGFADIAFGMLNILTSFIGAIIMGIGNDHGVYLLGRYKSELNQGANETDAIRTTFGNTGRAALVSALTTSVAFAGLSLSEFRVFREFGIIAAVGNVLMVLGYIVTMPALMALAMRFGWRAKILDSEVRAPMTGIIKRHAVAMVACFAVVFAVCAFMVPQIRFNYNFDSLGNSNLESFKLDLETNQILGYSQTPMVIMTDSLAEEAHAAKALRDNQAALGKESTLDFIVSGADLAPPNQEAKQPVIKAIGEILRQVKPGWLKPEQRKQLEAVLRMTDAKPFTRESLPVEVRRQFQGINGLASQGFVLAFPAIDTSEGQLIMKMAKEIRTVKSLEGKEYAAAGESLILADILTMVTNEAPKVIVLTLILTFLVALILIGRIGDTLLAIFPTVVTTVIALGLLPLMMVELNYLNIVLIPFIFGYGIESGAHLVTVFARDPDFERVYAPNARSTVGSHVTTALGFAPMLLAHHPGMRSLAALSCVGIGVNFVACLVLLPAVMLILRQWRERRMARPRMQTSALAEQGK